MPLVFRVYHCWHCLQARQHSLEGLQSCSLSHAQGAEPHLIMQSKWQNSRPWRPPLPCDAKISSLLLAGQMHKPNECENMAHQQITN
jgi:hypothetical protein